MRAVTFVAARATLTTRTTRAAEKAAVLAEAVAPRHKEATTAALHAVLTTAGSSKAASVRTNTTHEAATGSSRHALSQLLRHSADR